MATINPYLNFNGKTEEVFNFYKSVFGGEFATVMRYKDVPAGAECDGFKLGEADLDKIMHIALPIGDGDVLMGADTLEALGKLTAGNNFSISISAASREESERLFAALSAGGKVEMPLGDAFWGSYFGMCSDRYGIQWMVSYDPRYTQN